MRAPGLALAACLLALPAGGPVAGAPSVLHLEGPAEMTWAFGFGSLQAAPCYLLGDGFDDRVPGSVSVTVLGAGLAVAGIPADHLSWRFLGADPARPCALAVECVAGGSAGDGWAAWLCAADPGLVVAGPALGAAWLGPPDGEGGRDFVGLTRNFIEGGENVVGRVAPALPPLTGP